METDDEQEIEAYLRKHPDVHVDSILEVKSGQKVSLFDERYVSKDTCPLWYLCNSSKRRATLEKRVTKDEYDNTVIGFVPSKDANNHIQPYHGDLSCLPLTWYYGKDYRVPEKGTPESE